MTVGILGREYSVLEADLDGHAGEMDDTAAVIRVDPHGCAGVSDPGRARREVLRHELVHAFMAESGLRGSYCEDEVIVGWVAAMFPRLRVAFEECGCLD